MVKGKWYFSAKQKVYSLWETDFVGPAKPIAPDTSASDPIGLRDKVYFSCAKSICLWEAGAVNVVDTSNGPIVDKAAMEKAGLLLFAGGAADSASTQLRVLSVPKNADDTMATFDIIINEDGDANVEHLTVFTR